MYHKLRNFAEAVKEIYSYSPPSMADSKESAVAIRRAETRFELPVE
jgi:hypothetical protein